MSGEALLAQLEAVLREIDGADGLYGARSRARDGLAMIAASRREVGPEPRMGKAGLGSDPIVVPEAQNDHSAPHRDVSRQGALS